MDSGTVEKTGSASGGVEDIKAFIGNDENGQDKKSL